MKKNYLCFFFLIIQINLFGQAKLDYDPNKWVLEFEDEFNYNNSSEMEYPDSPYKLGEDTGLCSESTSYNKAQVVVENGILKLKSKRTKGTFVDFKCTGNDTTDELDKQYKSGAVKIKLKTDHDTVIQDANGNYSACHWTGFKYGMVEIRCKLPDPYSTWPAFWLNDNGGDEIDIFEFNGDRPSSFRSNFHDWNGSHMTDTDYVENNPSNTDLPDLMCEVQHEFYNNASYNGITCKNNDDCRDLREEFHTFTMVWVPVGPPDPQDNSQAAQYTFFMDGREVRTETRFIDHDCTKTIILNNASVSWSEYGSSSFDIDYIRVYRQIQEPPLPPNSQNDTPYSNSSMSNSWWYMYNYKPIFVRGFGGIYPGLKSLAVGTNNNFFYRNSVNRMIHGFYDGLISQTTTLPCNLADTKVAGDINIGENNKVFYRGGDGRLQHYYLNGLTYAHGYIDNNWGTSAYKISSACGALSVGESNEVLYRGTDNWIYRFKWNGIWQPDALPKAGLPTSAKVAGDVVVGKNNAIFYRGVDGRIHMYYKDWGNEPYIHTYISAANHLVSSDCGSLEVAVIDGENYVFYRGTDEKMYYYYWDNTWKRGDLPHDISLQDVAGDIDAGIGDKIFYTGADGKMQMYYRNNGWWYHMWVNENITDPFPNSEKLSNTSNIAVVAHPQYLGQNIITYSNQYRNIGFYKKESSNGEVVDLDCGVMVSDANPHMNKLIDSDKNLLNTKYNLQIYPQPVNDYVQIGVDNDEIIKKVTLFDSAGRVLYEKNFDNSNKVDLLLEDIPGGIYPIQIKLNDLIVHDKIIKL